MIFLRLSIGKFGSSFARPVSCGEGKIKIMGPSRNIVCLNFLFGGDFSFIRGCRKHECTRKINRARFCCLSGLEVIRHFNKVLYIRPPLHMFARFRGTRCLTLTVRFHLKSVFISCLGNIYCYFLWVFKVSDTSRRRSYLRGSYETGEIELSFSLFVSSFS